jgi:hypothetical protein
LILRALRGAKAPLFHPLLTCALLKYALLTYGFVEYALLKYGLLM